MITEKGRPGSGGGWENGENVATVTSVKMLNDLESEGDARTPAGKLVAWQYRSLKQNAEVAREER